MRKTTTITAIIIVLLFTALNTPTATATENTNNGYQYYAYPLLVENQYIVTWGLNLSTGKQLTVDYYTKVTAELYGYTNDKWTLLANKEFTVRFMQGYQTTNSTELTWTTTWTFIEDLSQRTWPLTVVFSWMDNMNLTNWVDFPDASVQVNTTHWSHAVTWSKTITLPKTNQGIGNNQQEIDPVITAVVALTCLVIALVFVMRLRSAAKRSREERKELRRRERREHG